MDEQAKRQTDFGMNKATCVVLQVMFIRRLDLFNMMHHLFPMPGKRWPYFEAISLLPKHVGPVLINDRAYMLAKNS